MVFKQAESEIAAINMVVGAANSGVRAMTATSGGGFDLMTEGLSLAAMFETPLVILLGQRPGPATGLPTRSNQPDLNLAMYAGHGEFTRVIISPHTVQEFYHSAIRAFNLADILQCQVIVMSDQQIASSLFGIDMDAFQMQDTLIDRGKLLTAEQVDAMPDYKRYKLTEDGISPRAIAGSSANAIFLTTSDEHDERGAITEGAEMAARMADKRLAKAKVAESLMRPPFCYGPEEADITFVCWGTTFGPVVESVKQLETQGTSANVVCFVDIWPFLVQAAQHALDGAKRLVGVEQNKTAQFMHLLRAETGIEMQQIITKYDGRRMTPEYILGILEVK